MIFGSGVPVIAEFLVDVAREGRWFVVGGARFVYEPEAGLLRSANNCTRRLVPHGPPHDYTPCLTSEGIDTKKEHIKALTHEDPWIRREAILAIASRRRNNSRQRFPEVVPLLDDPVLQVRLFAIWAVSQCHMESAVPRLLKNLNDERPAVRRESALGLGWGRLGGAKAVAPLQKTAAEDPDGQVRAAAKQALGNLRRE